VTKQKQLKRTTNHAPRSLIKTFTAWSWSRYSDHVKCPAQAKYRHLDKLPTPKGPALIRGGRIDELATAYLTGKLRKLPPELAKFREGFAALRDRGAEAQAKLAVDRSWQLVDFFDWARAWGRMVLDASFIEKKRAHVIDFKTGNIYPENEAQLELYAIPMFERYPDADEVKVRLWYLDHGSDAGVRVYQRSGFVKLKKTWERRLVPLLTDMKFPPRPGQHCGWCPFAKKKGGPCIY